jgi:hypothetical protein
MPKMNMIKVSSNTNKSSFDEEGTQNHARFWV